MPFAQKRERNEYIRGWLRRKTLANFGLTEIDVKAMLLAQGGKCAMSDCEATHPGRGGTWLVDHDHTTGEVRGLLCNKCNIRLGYYEKDKQRHALFEEYLRNPPYRRIV